MCYVQAIGYAQEGDVLLHERGDATNGEGSERGLMSDISEFMSTSECVDPYSQRIIDHRPVCLDVIGSLKELTTQILDDNAHVVLHGSIQNGANAGDELLSIRDFSI